MISVIIPTHNRGFCIEECINNVLAQTFDDFEIIVVDDCSTDDTAERIAAMNNSKIRYIRNEKNLGAGGARNAGVAAAKGDYIAFQDSDDLWHPHKLQLQMERLTETGTDMTFCQFEVEDRGCYISGNGSDLIENLQPHIFQLLLVEPFISTQTILCKKSCFDALGGFDQSLRCFEDYEFSLRFAEKYTISYLNTLLVTIRHLDVGVNSNQTEKLRALGLLFERYYHQLLEHELVAVWAKNISIVAKQSDLQMQLQVLSAVKKLISTAH